MNDSVNEDDGDALNEAPKRSRRGRALTISLVGVCLVVAVTGTAFALSSSKPSSAGAAVVVRRALDTTLATNSLSFTLSESVDAASTTIALSGNGECNLSSALCGMTMDYSGVLSSAGTIRVVYSGSTVYLNLGSALSGLLSTPWISLPVSNSNSASLGVSSSPLAGLSMLASEGASVTNDGSVTENGQMMTQYTVSVDASQVQHLITSNAAKFPSWMTGAASKFSSGTIVETVDVDAAGRLGYLGAKVNETVAGTSVGVNIDETVTGYGVPVTVTVPPSSEVTSITNLSQLSGL
jgi:predicted lipoprotein with Yx(FWY)xxD motif